MLHPEENGGHRTIATARHVVEIVAIVAAGFWAFYTFIFEERIKPAHEPLSAAESITMTRDGRIRDLDIIRTTIVIRNAGKTEFDTVGLLYEIHGFQYGKPTRHTSGVGYNSTLEDAAQPQQPHLITSSYHLYDAAIHGEPNVRNIIEPGSQSTYTVYVAVPRGRYDLLKAHLQYLPYKTPEVTQHFAVDVRPLPDGGYELFARNRDLLEDNVYSELALTQ